MDDGFANLLTPVDLFRKLEHDRERMSRDPSDMYAAVDFFVTAEHLLDWILPDEVGRSKKKARQTRRKNAPLLKITSRIASGAKHFRATAQHHDSVRHADVREGEWDSRSFSTDAFSQSSFAMNGLHVQLEDDTLVHVYTLADQVLGYWRGERGLG